MIGEKHGPGTAGVPAWFPRGLALLREPTLNKGTAFTESERAALGIRGLLPPRAMTQDIQVARVLENFRKKTSDLEKYINLNALHDRNEALFYRVVGDHPDEMMPIIYTPTVGLACQQFGHIFQRPRGIFIGANDRGRIASVLRNWPYQDVRIIVVTDGERILGLGDLGANGMGIPVGKLSLYTACAGVHPTQGLPVILDVGTRNEALRNDPLYIGLAQDRLQGDAYDAFIEEFVEATQQVFPGCIVQFEDFANHNAFRLLGRYRDRIACFNDDIQGTAAVTLAGLLSALRVTGGKLSDQRILFLGAGEAATGIADLTATAMMDEGVSESVARSRISLVDSKGLVVAARTDLAPQKRPYAHAHAAVADFPSAVRALKPTAIIGVAAVGGTFTKEVVEEMTRNNKRPIIFALSNPTSKSECTAKDAYAWSNGQALYASGSPFDPVTIAGKTHVSRQGNNSYIFPGVGMGAIVSRTTRITDAMFLTAARTLAKEVTETDLAQGSLYPPLASIRDVSAKIAAAVATVAFKTGVARAHEPTDILAYVRSQMYDPHYVDYVASE